MEGKQQQPQLLHMRPRLHSVGSMPKLRRPTATISSTTFGVNLPLLLVLSVRSTTALLVQESLGEPHGLGKEDNTT